MTRGLARLTLSLTLVCGVLAPSPDALAQGGGDVTFQDAREAWRNRDRARLNAARDALVAMQHPLAPWADYWATQVRLTELGRTEADEFMARWPDAYVVDRFRNDWLLELGHRGDWATFLRVQPTFKMNDDRDVVCWGILARHQLGMAPEGPGDMRERARSAWWAQREADKACDSMAQTLWNAGVLKPEDVWRKLRLAVEADRSAVVQQSSKLFGDAVAQAVSRLMTQPQAFLMPADAGASGAFSGKDAGQRPASIGPTPGKSKDKKAKKSAKSKRPQVAPIPMAIPADEQGGVNLLAFIRWANIDPLAAAQAMADPAARARWRWNAEETAWAWAQLGRASAWRLSNEAVVYFERALADRSLANVSTLTLTPRSLANWSPETLAWMARSAVRAAAAGDASKWALVEQAIDAMGPDQMVDAAWTYWRARAWLAKAGPGAQDPWRQKAREALGRIANPLHFYGQLAHEELHGAPARAPARPMALSDAELDQARAMPGVVRALKLFELGWRSEAVKEWNFTMGYGKPGGLTDRDLLAAAAVACEREIWDRCINTSDRTRQEIDLTQRYPMPFRHDGLAAAQEVGLDPAYMYGLMRQESRFIVNARSVVGASGLMQVMPATAAWTARKLGIPYTPDLITDRMTNLRIGAGYLKLVLDDLGGSQAMAAAAYNAGPSRPRRWREGARLDAAAWVENIPFTETRDYVKKVLGNAVVYAHLIDGVPMSVRKRLGQTIGPRATTAPQPDMDLP